MLLSMVASFIKRQEFVYARGTVDILLNDNFNQSNSGQNDGPTEKEDIMSINTVSSHNPRTKSGQPTIASIFPNIIIETTSFFKQQGYATYCRHRTERGCTSGVTFEQIRTHLLSRVAMLPQHAISLPTVTRMFHPSRMTNVI